MHATELREREIRCWGKVSDADLTLYAKAGERDAVAELFYRYRAKLFTVILGIVPCQHQAEDILQETFVRIIQNLSRFRGESGPYTWRFRIAKIVCYSHLR